MGINRRTGSRWRYGRTITNRADQPLTYPSILTPARPVSPRFLSQDEQIAIGDGLIASTMRLIPNSRLYIFGQCGRWTRIERTDEFVDLLDGFLPE